MSHGPYSSEKIPWLILHEGWPPKAPKQVQVILSDLCQMDCVDASGDPWCAYRMPGYTSNQLFTRDAEVSKFGHNNPRRFMPRDRALRLLVEMQDAGVKALQFTGGGEPLLHPSHAEIFRAALQLGFECSLVSNGLALTEEVIEMLTRFSWVRISMDAGSAETYAKTRTTHPSNYKKVLGNISAISQAIERSGTATALGVGFVIMPHNWHEVDAATLDATVARAHNIRLSAMFSPDDEKPYLEIHDRIRNMIAIAKQRESSRFKVYDLFGDRIEDLKLHNPDYPICAKMHYCSYIGADLQVYVCCVYSYNEQGKIAGDLGNLKDRRFDEFWASQDRKSFMRDFNPRQCERCQFNPTNRAANALLDPEPPMHVNFP